jgi:hypothetical protein
MFTFFPRSRDPLLDFFFPLPHHFSKSLVVLF